MLKTLTLLTTAAAILGAASLVAGENGGTHPFRWAGTEGAKGFTEETRVSGFTFCGTEGSKGFRATSGEGVHGLYFWGNEGSHGLHLAGGDGVKV